MQSSGLISDSGMRAGMEELIAGMKNRRPAHRDDGSASEPMSCHESDGVLAAAPWRAVGRPSDPDEEAVGGQPLQGLPQGAIVGRYMVIKQLGAGAMGVVYAAFDPELDRKVALKLLKRGVSSDEGHERLLREAQALGKLAHPNIVAIHDVGTLGEQVWLAMEFVQGRTLGAWLAEPRDWREVVRVMRSAGRGLSAAHAAGLLHRDFKPDNAMVADDGRVRVMDFGLARAGPEGLVSEAEPSQQPTVETLAMQLTEVGAKVGTPAYMAPEQWESRELTAAADQFAYCVTLWQALYGERPFTGRTREELGLNVLAGRRRPPPTDRRVPGRLRRACERGLATDPGQRWPSMEALLDELRQIAAPLGRRWLALGVAGGLVALGGGLALAQYVAVMDRCTGARTQLEGTWDQAKRQQVRNAIVGTKLVYAPGTWERVEQRLDGYAEAWASKHTEVCEATRVTEEQSEAVMELRMGCLRERRMSLHAAVKVLAQADAEVVENAAELVAGLPMLDRCDDIALLEKQRQRVPPPDEPQVEKEVESMREQLASIEAEQAAGKYAQALQQVEPLVQRAEALGYAPLLAEVELRRGSLLSESGRYADAERELKAAYTLALEHDHDDVVLGSAEELTVVVGVRQARHAEGIIWGQTALPLAERGGKDVELAMGLGSLGNVLDGQGEYEQAKQQHQRALQVRENSLGADHLHVAWSLNDLGIVLKHQGEYEQAKLHLQRALQIKEGALSADHPHVAMSLSSLASVFDAQGEPEQAKLHYRRALQIREDALGPDHPSVAATLHNLGSVIHGQGEYEQAKLHYQRALQIWEKALGTDHPNVAMGLSNLGIVFYEQGEYEQAKLHYQRALQIWEKTLGTDHPDLARGLNNLGIVFDEQGEIEQAKLHHQRALQIREKALGVDHPDVATSLNNLGIVFLEQGEYEEAKLHYQRALQIQEKALGANHPKVADSLWGLAKVGLAQDQSGFARAHAERALSIRQAGEVAPELLAESRALLAQALWADRSQHARAVELAEQARDELVALGEPQRESLIEIERWLAEHLAR